MKLRIGSVLLAVLVLIAAVAMGVCAEERETTTFMDYSGHGFRTVELSDVNAAPLPADGNWGTVGGDTWYVVDGAVSVDAAAVAGCVRIILKENCTLDVPGGITMAEDGNLLIYAQTQDAATMGHMRVAGGVGGGLAVYGGEVTVSGDAAAVAGRLEVQYGKVTLIGTGAALGGELVYNEEMLLFAGADEDTAEETDDAAGAAYVQVIYNHAHELAENGECRICGYNKYAIEANGEAVGSVIGDGNRWIVAAVAAAAIVAIAVIVIARKKKASAEG